MPTIVRPSSVWCRGRRANTAFGCVTTPTRGRAVSLIADNVPAGSTQLYTDEWQSYRGSHPSHATVRHGVHEWARDEDDDGRREVHCNTCEGAGAGLRTYLRAFRGVHKQYLHLYVATYEAMLNTKRVTPMLIHGCAFVTSQHTLVTHEPKHFPTLLVKSVNHSHWGILLPPHALSM